MSSSKKNCITSWFKKSEKENDKRTEEEPLAALPENEWYVIF